MAKDQRNLESGPPPPWNWLESPPPHHRRHAEENWRSETLATLAQAHMQHNPDFVAMIDGEGQLTMRQWYDDALALAAAMNARGLQVGDVVAFQVPNWREVAVINLAAVMAGLIVNPIVPIYRDAEVRQMLEDCNARAIFTCTRYRKFDFAAMALRLADDLLYLDNIFTVRGGGTSDYETLLEEGRGLSFQPVDVDSASVKMVLYTSGTTGTPKGVLHAHATIDYILRKSAAHWGVEAGDGLLMPSPVTHISGFANGLEMPLVAGTRTVLMEAWDADSAIDLIKRHELDGTVAATPFLVELSEAAKKRGKKLPGFRFFACGGAAVPPDLIPTARDAFAHLSPFRVYGASEVPLVTYGWPGNRDLAATTDGEVVDYDVLIVDDDGCEVAGGAQGEILARGPAMMLGYADRDQTAEAITEAGYFCTGDLGRLDENGALTITGRKKDLIIRGGENISAVEIEDVLRQHPAIGDVSVVAMPHERLGEGVCAYLIAEGRAPERQSLIDHMMASGLAKQKIPEHFDFVQNFPRTASGKVRKDRLREMIADQLRG